MKTTPFARHCLASLAAALLIAPAAYAGQTSAEATYQKERAQCYDGTSHQSRHDCLYEAQSAYNEARNGKLHSDDAQTLAQNAIQRCQVQPAGDERTACLRMARGRGYTSGSVEDGGVLKEVVTVKVGPVPPTPTPVPAPTTP